LPRLKKIGFWWTTIVVGLFTLQAVWFTYQAKEGAYLNNTELQEQYLESVDCVDINAKISQIGLEFQKEIYALEKQGLSEADIQAKAAEIMPKYQKMADSYLNFVKVFCKDTPQGQYVIQQEEAQKAMQALPEEMPMEELEEVDTTNVQPQN
jgi:hypothetical protein